MPTKKERAKLDVPPEKPLIPKPKIHFDPNRERAEREKAIKRLEQQELDKRRKKTTLSEFFKTFYALNSDKIAYVWEFMFTVIIYGLLLNFTVSQILNYSFSIEHILATGIGFYFLKEELPRIIIKATFKRGS